MSTNDVTTTLTGLKLGNKSISMSVGDMTSLNIILSPSTAKGKVTINWKYDPLYLQVVQTSGGALLTALKEGQTSLVAECQGYSEACIVKISGFSDAYDASVNPYIYSNTNIIQMTPSSLETFYVSLYGGSVADIDSYTWTIDNPTVATIVPTGQYCKVKALQEGYARIKVTHAKATYPYYIGLYVFADYTKPCYITTDNNIITLYKNSGDKNISVGLINSPEENYESGFNWEVIQEQESISIVNNGNKAILTPVASGLSTIRVTHPSTTGNYPLDITVRVVEIVENVYINPSQTIVTLSGNTTQEISAALVGLKAGTEYSVDEFTFSINNPEVCTGMTIGNKISLTGVKNGTTNITISHPKSEKTRQVLVISENQISDAVDSTVYVTTSQSYIKTKVGAEETALNILLKGGVVGDQKDFNWEISQNPADGISEVIEVSTTTGNVSNNRAASNTYVGGISYIKPLAEGTATIKITHPKTYYPTEVLVKVLPSTAILEDPLYFIGNGFLRLLNGAEETYEVILSGGNSTEEQKITWEIDNPLLALNSSGNTAVIKSNASGPTVSHLTINHPKVESKKQVIVITADTTEELNSVKAFYSDKMNYSLNVGKNCTISVNTLGYDTFDETTGEYIPYDFSLMSWTSSKPGVAIVEKENDPVNGIVTGITSGTTTITASLGSQNISFNVTVYPENVEIGKVENITYLTTSNNVVNLSQIGLTKKISVSAINLDTAKLHQMEWNCTKGGIIDVIPNGTTASITAFSEGEEIIEVSHPESENKLKIYVKVGSEYVIENPPVVYISSNTECINLQSDSSTYKLTTLLTNADSANSTNEFSYTIDNTSVATITAQYATGSCFIKANNPGIAELTVSHPSSVSNKQILVIVGNTLEELNGLKYLSTGQNVVTVSESGNRTISVSMKNTSDVVLDGYAWQSLDSSIATVTSSSASTAVITGNKIGTTKIKVTHSDCNYPLEIIVQVVDPIVATANPYLQSAQSVLTLTKSSTWTTVTAELVGGKSSDNQNIQWSSSDSSILQVIGQNGEGKIRAIGTGTAYVNISHVKSPYDAQILVICDESNANNCSISVSENIITMKPTESSKTITANLTNGDIADKYNFRFSLDVYDIVDLDYTANTAIITPKQQGQVALTISHPKSAYDQTIIIKVSEYTSFGFSSTTKTLTAGKSSFISMQVPASTIKTHVEYSSESPLVAAAQGTKAVCQITGLAPGTTKVFAKLIATATNVVQAEAEILVSVEEGTNNLVYITAQSTIHTMEMGTNKTLSATLTGAGVIPTDQHNLTWSSSDPTIVQLKGASTTGVATGQSVYVTALKAGETTITISHEKSNTNLVLYIIVPGADELSVKLNKTYIKIDKGSSTEIKAQIDGGKTEDYNSLVWSVDKISDLEIVRLLGSGNIISAYGINPGTVTIRCQLPNGKSASCEIEVQSTKTFNFATTTVRIQPGQTKQVKYAISPYDAGLQWVQNDDSYIMFEDVGNNNGEGIVSITGIKEGNSTLTGVTSYGNKATLQVICSWDYNFNVDKIKLQGTPDKVYSVNYSVCPTNAELLIDDCNIANIEWINNGDGTGIINFTPKNEGQQSVSIRAKNPATGTDFITKNIALDFKYTSLTANPSIIYQQGNHSRYDPVNNILIIGDGENINLKINVLEPNVVITDYTFTLENVSSSSITYFKGDTSDSVKLSHSTDYLEYNYIITGFYEPISSTGLSLNPKTDFYWHSYWGNFDKEKRYVLTCSASSDTVSKKRVYSQDGIIMTAAEFESIPWYFRPYQSSGTGWSGITTGPWAAQPTGNVDSVKIPTEDTTIISYTYTNLLKVVIKHNNTESLITIPIYTETRASVCK